MDKLRSLISRFTAPAPPATDPLQSKETEALNRTITTICTQAAHTEKISPDNFQRLTTHWDELKRRNAISPDLVASLESAADKLDAAAKEILLGRTTKYAFEQLCANIKKQATLASPTLNFIEVTRKLQTYWDKLKVDLPNGGIGSQLSRDVEEAAGLARAILAKNNRDSAAKSSPSSPIKEPAGLLQLHRINFTEMHDRINTNPAISLTADELTIFTAELNKFWEPVLKSKKIKPELGKHILLVANSLIENAIRLGQTPDDKIEKISEYLTLKIPEAHELRALERLDFPASPTTTPILLPDAPVVPSAVHADGNALADKFAARLARLRPQPTLQSPPIVSPVTPSPLTQVTELPHTLASLKTAAAAIALNRTPASLEELRAIKKKLCDLSVHSSAVGQNSDEIDKLVTELRKTETFIVASQNPENSEISGNSQNTFRSYDLTGKWGEGAACHVCCFNTAYNIFHELARVEPHPSLDDATALALARQQRACKANPGLSRWTRGTRFPGIANIDAAIPYLGDLLEPLVTAPIQDLLQENEEPEQYAKLIQDAQTALGGREGGVFIAKNGVFYALTITKEDGRDVFTVMDSHGFSSESGAPPEFIGRSFKKKFYKPEEAAYFLAIRTPYQTPPATTEFSKMKTNQCTFSIFTLNPDYASSSLWAVDISTMVENKTAHLAELQTANLAVMSIKELLRFYIDLFDQPPEAVRALQPLYLNELQSRTGQALTREAAIKALAHQDDPATINDAIKFFRDAIKFFRDDAIKRPPQELLFELIELTSLNIPLEEANSIAQKYIDALRVLGVNIIRSPSDQSMVTLRKLAQDQLAPLLQPRRLIEPPTAELGIMPAEEPLPIDPLLASFNENFDILYPLLTKGTGSIALRLQDIKHHVSELEKLYKTYQYNLNQDLALRIYLFAERLQNQITMSTEEIPAELSQKLTKISNSTKAYTDDYYTRK